MHKLSIVIAATEDQAERLADALSRMSAIRSRCGKIYKWHREKDCKRAANPALATMAFGAEHMGTCHEAAIWLGRACARLPREMRRGE